MQAVCSQERSKLTYVELLKWQHISNEVWMNLLTYQLTLRGVACGWCWALTKDKLKFVPGSAGMSRFSSSSPVFPSSTQGDIGKPTYSQTSHCLSTLGCLIRCVCNPKKKNTCQPQGVNWTASQHHSSNPYRQRHFLTRSSTHSPLFVLTAIFLIVACYAPPPRRGH